MLMKLVTVPHNMGNSKRTQFKAYKCPAHELRTRECMKDALVSSILCPYERPRVQKPQINLTLVTASRRREAETTRASKPLSVRTVRSDAGSMGVRIVN